MTLSAVGKTLEKLRVATAGQLAMEMGADRESVEAALAYWIHRGNVSECSIEVGCGTSCRRCPLGRAPGLRAISGTAYEWADGNI